MSGWPMADVVLTSHQNVTNSTKDPEKGPLFPKVSKVKLSQVMQKV